MVVDRLDSNDVERVLDLVQRAGDVDGVAPLSEHVLLHLRRGGEEPGRHLLVHGDDGAQVVGYAHLDPTDAVEGPSSELVVDPYHRRRGHARRLVEALHERTGGTLRLWAHGDCPDARSLAAAMGFQRVRELWQMRRSLHASLPSLQVPDGVTVRTFVPADADALLRLNAEAFADHPEQGRWTRADLDARLAESWFDPAGVFLAEDGSGLLGFHWTKVHGAQQHGAGPVSHAHEPVGEVYVVGVSPHAQGRGLGRVLTLVGLHHLRQRRLSQVLLYVDADNDAAVRTYTSLGFTRWDVDVQFRRAG